MTDGEVRFKGYELVYFSSSSDRTSRRPVHNAHWSLDQIQYGDDIL